MATLYAGDFSQATESAIGFPDSRAATDPDGRTTRSVQVGAGPSGANTIRWTHLPISSAAVGVIGNTQNTHCSGIAKNSAFVTRAAGGSMFIHLYCKHVAATNVVGWNPPAGAPTLNGDILTYKAAIIGSGSSRVIIQSRWESTTWQLFISRNVDNGPGTTFTIADGWTSLIFQMTSATSLGGSDGILRCWKNGAAQGSPTDELTGVSIDSADWTAIQFNEFGNETLAQDTPTPDLKYEIGGMKVTDTFDASWFSNMTGGAGSTGRLVFRR